MLFSVLQTILQNEYDIFAKCSFDQNIQYIRFLDQHMEQLLDNTLYIGFYHNFPLEKIHHPMYKNFVIFNWNEDSEEPQTGLLDNNNLLLPDPKVKLAQLFNQIQDILSEDLTKSLDVNYQKLFIAENLDKLLEHLSVIVNNPSLVIDYSGSVLGYSHQEYFLQSPTWKKIIENGQLDLQLDYSILEKGQPFYSSFGQNQKTIVCPISLPQNLNIILLVPALFTFTTRLQCNIVRTAGNLISDKFITEILSRRAREYSLEDTLRKILSGNKNISLGIELMERSIFIEPDEGFFVCSCSHLPNTSAQRQVIQQLLEMQNTTVFTFQQYIVCFAQHTIPVSRFLKKLIDISQKNRVVIGLSQPFDSLKDLQKYYRQTISVLNYVDQMKLPPDVYHSDTFCFLKPFERPLDPNDTKQERIHEYCSSIVWYLKDYDKKNSTDFFETLRQYVYHDRNCKECAAALHIHRNTLNYRLGQISDVLGNRNLFDPNTFFILSYSFRVFDYFSSIYDKTS